MHIVTGKVVHQQFAFKKDIGRIFNYKDPTRLLKSFRDYADDNTKAFHPHRPYIKNIGMDTLYNILAFAYFIENKDLLEAGTRSISFKEELPRLKEVYQ